MNSPFENDIFGMIWQAFKKLYPNKKCKCFYDPTIEENKNGDKVYGVTEFLDDGEIIVSIIPELPVCDCAEIFAHELAHVAVGANHNHDEKWEKSFDDIFKEYNRIGDELFDAHNAIKVTDGKAYVKNDETASD